jgi:hypothetical protein
MKKVQLAVISVAALTALALAASATAAYSTAKLSVSYTAGGVTRIVASSDVADDATARAAIVISPGTTLTTTAAPGSKVGTVKAQVSALALGGALLPLAGDIIVAPPGAVPAASQTQCIQTATPSATYLLVLQAAGQTINLPAYVIPTDATEAALGASSQLVFCLAPPDIPTTSGGATFGAKFLSADMSFTNVFSPLTSALWMAFWTPWTPAVGTLNLAGTVASADLIAPGAVTLKGKRVKGRVTLTGKATQGGVGAAYRVQVWGAVGKAAFKPLKSVSAKDNGTYSLVLAKTAKQTSFQAKVVVSEGSVTGDTAKTICTGLFSSLPVPCSSFTVSGFSAKSKSVVVK